MFEQASRLKIRFNTPVGNITVEDLWDLPLLSTRGQLCLDDLAKALHTSVKESGETSFVVKKKKADEVLELKFDIVKHVITVKLAEAEQNQNQVAIKAEKEKLMRIIAKKEDESLEGESVAALKKRIKALENSQK